MAKGQCPLYWVPKGVSRECHEQIHRRDPLDAARLEIEHLKEDNAGLLEQIAQLKKAVEKLATGTQVAHLVPNPEKDLVAEVDWDAVPEADPMLGNRTPGRKEYLIENHPALAKLWKLTK